MMEDRPEIWNGARVPYDASTAELERLAQGPAPERWAAFVALAHSRDESALAFLEKSTESPDPHVRRFAVEALGLYPDGSRVSGTIVRRLTDTHPVVVRSACEAASRQRLAQAHDAILRLLDSPDISTRRSAVSAIRVLWLEGDFDRVFRAFRFDPSSEVQREAAWTLRAVATASTWLRLFKVWEIDALARHRGWAAELAGTYGNEEISPHLQRLATDSDGHVRDRAILALQDVSARSNRPSGN